METPTEVLEALGEGAPADERLQALVLYLRRVFHFELQVIKRFFFSSDAAPPPSCPTPHVTPPPHPLYTLADLLSPVSQSGVQYGSQAELFEARGEACVAVCAAPERVGGADASIPVVTRRVEAFLKCLEELEHADAEAKRAAEEAVAAFYAANTVDEGEGKYRCPLSGKLFRDPVPHPAPTLTPTLPLPYPPTYPLP